MPNLEFSVERFFSFSPAKSIKNDQLMVCLVSSSASTQITFLITTERKRNLSEIEKKKV